MARGVQIRSWLGIVIAVAVLAGAGRAGLAQPQSNPGLGPAPSNPSVFLVYVVRRTATGGYRGVEHGSGFFINQDGTALTASHVATPAVRDPKDYLLIAIVGSDMYSVQVVCAAKLDYDPLHQPSNGITPSRDVAEIRLTDQPVPFRQWVFHFKGNPPIPFAARHTGPLPAFPPLAFGREPGEGAPVTVVGFGHISPIPYQFVATGTVASTAALKDMTPGFRIAFTEPATHGDSGGPVLDGQGRVVGILDWVSKADASLGTALGVNAFTPEACR